MPAVGFRFDAFAKKERLSKSLNSSPESCTAALGKLKSTGIGVAGSWVLAAGTPVASNAPPLSATTWNR